MRTYLDESDTQEESRRSASSQGADREITLGTTMILLIFFALAVYGAVLFGFGYSLGSKHSESAAVPIAAPSPSASFNAFKPAAGSPIGSSSPQKSPAAPATESATIPLSVPPKAEPAESKVIAAATDFEATTAKSKTTPASPTAAGEPPIALPIAANGTFVVQVAAVSHQEDADLIASTLKRRGYVVNIRGEADKLLHVQVGPFANRKDADAMKAKLLADGFNAYIK